MSNKKYFQKIVFLFGGLLVFAFAQTLKKLLMIFKFLVFRLAFIRVLLLMLEHFSKVIPFKYLFQLQVDKITNWHLLTQNKTLKQPLMSTFFLSSIGLVHDVILLVWLSLIRLDSSSFFNLASMQLFHTLPPSFTQ